MALINTTQMVISPAGPISVLKVDGTKLFNNIRPVFSFEYQAMKFINSVQHYLLADGTVVDMTEAQIAEVSAYLETVQEDPALTAALRANDSSLRYLSTTDWYVVRLMETGVPIPADITAARAIARSSITVV